jgi:hypothetical protein
MKFGIRVFFDNISRKLKFHYNTTRIAGTLHEERRSCISRRILLRMRNASLKSSIDNQNTRPVFNKPPPEIRSSSEIMWKNVVEPDRTQLAIKYGACALLAGYQRLQIHTQNM